jgi:hypothetical protein
MAASFQLNRTRAQILVLRGPASLQLSRRARFVVRPSIRGEYARGVSISSRSFVYATSRRAES